jgi:hypothetical protein
VNPIIHNVIEPGENVFTANPQYHFVLKQIDLMKQRKSGDGRDQTELHILGYRAKRSPGLL